MMGLVGRRCWRALLLHEETRENVEVHEGKIDKVR